MTYACFPKPARGHWIVVAKSDTGEARRYRVFPAAPEHSHAYYRLPRIFVEVKRLDKRTNDWRSLDPLGPAATKVYEALTTQHPEVPR